MIQNDTTSIALNENTQIILAWSSALVLAASLDAPFRGRRWGALVIVLLSLHLAALGPLLARPLAGETGRGPLAVAARTLERRLGVPARRSEPEGLVRRPAAGEPAAPEHRAHFRAVCAFARDETDASDLFLVPPEHWGAFRAYARRGAAVTRKEGGACLSFLGARGAQWYGDYADAVRVYASGGPADWLGLARRFGARYAVVDPAAPAPAAWPEVFASGPYRVLRVASE